MPNRNIILNSLQETFALIWKNKLLFVLLFILQIIFFVILSLITYKYVPKMVESQKAIEDYMSSLKLDEPSVSSSILQQKSILGDDPLMISRNFNEIAKNFRIYLIYVFILMIIFISTAWSITNKMINKNNFKQSAKNFLKISVVLLFYLGLIFAFFFSLLNISFTEIAADGKNIITKYIIFLLVSIALAYFMFISLSLTYRIEFKNIVQKTLSVGIKKIHYIFLVYFINIFLFIIAIILLYYFIEKNLFILLFSLILMIFSFIFGRIFIINVVEKLEN